MARWWVVAGTTTALLVCALLLWPVTADACKGPPGTSCDAQVTLAGLRLPQAPAGTGIATTALALILIVGVALSALLHRRRRARSNVR